MESFQTKKRRISLYFILDTISYLLVFLAGMSFMLSNVALIPTPIGTVTSRSMEPLMTIGDVVFVQPISIEDVKVGDIIAYHSPPDTTIIHRVVEIRRFPGRIYLTTKGDANPVTDQSVGYPPVSINNLIGEVFCLDGIPFRIPFIGIYIIDARNFAIWLTQNKIWAFWGPLIAMVYFFGPYLSPKGISKFDLRRSLKTIIPVRKVLLYTLISFVAISAFTFYFKTETYTLSMRVACLIEDKEPAYISFGSMIFEEVKNNTIEVTGAPLFPVKTVAIIFGNASRMVRSVPSTMIVEPQDFTSLILQARIPPRGEVEPGIYRADVHIFSDTLLILVPDAIIFYVFHIINNPWVSLILLDALIAFVLASLIALIALTLNYLSKQILYTLVWRDELEAVPPHILRIKMYAFKKRVSPILQRISEKIGKGFSIIKREVLLKKILIPSNIAIVPSVALFFILDNLILPIMTLGLVLGFLVWKFNMRDKSELITSVGLANLALTIAFIMRHATVFLYSQINLFWCMISSGFVGNVSYMITMPIVATITIISFIMLNWMRIWYLEQQTINWGSIRTSEITIERTITIPSLEEFEKLKRRKLKVAIPRVLDKVVTIFRNAMRHLLRFSRSMHRLFKILENQIRVLFLSIRKTEIKLIEREIALLVPLNRLRKNLGSAKVFLRRLMSDLFWLTHSLGREVVQSIQRR